jgi:hypothetical protein
MHVNGGSMVRHFSPLILAAKMGFCMILLLFVAELAVFSQHLGEGKEHISGSILDGMSIDKSQFVSSLDRTRYNILTSTKRTIAFTMRLTNHTGTNIRAGNISIVFQSQEHDIADPATTTFDLANGTSKLITVLWQPAVQLDSCSCTVITTVYDAANDKLGSLKEPLLIT